ncbi:hypothetical protein VTL71DRAFT_11247 [Oculimacula yallundae]|uniref:Uncharacterized protein n=1 Tax=Oculimacula yallundae TaxID=86028 RepID=A0ABR4CXL2_9HELO
MAMYGESVFFILGYAKINAESSVWDIWDGANPVHQGSFVDDPQYEDGSRFSCCNRELCAEGCQKGFHQPETR